MSKKRKFIFNEEKLLRLKIPEKSQIMYRDKKEKHLGLRIGAGGSKTFYFFKKDSKKFGRETKFVRIGLFPAISVDVARRAVHNMIEEIYYTQTHSLGSSLNEVAKRQIDKHVKVDSQVLKITFTQLVEKYINNHLNINSVEPKKALENVQTASNQVQSIHNKLICDISQEDILAIFHRISRKAPMSANKVLAFFHAIFNKAIQWNLLKINPARSIKKHKETARERYIQVEEKDIFINALKNFKSEVMKDIFSLALYTGARKGNILSMRWDKISFESKTWSIPSRSSIPSQGSKNGTPVVIPLHDPSIKILTRRKENSNSEWVFPSSSSKSGHIEEVKGAWKKLCKSCNMKDLKIHDLRHTLASWMAIKGENLGVISKVLGHKRIASTMRYAHLNLDSLKSAIERTLEGVEI